MGGTPAEVGVPGKFVAPGHREAVVDRHTRAHVPPLDDPFDQREEERQRLDQMGTQHGHHPPSFGERLSNQREVTLLEVTQSAVDELGRLARRPGRQVDGLDEEHRQSSLCGVEGNPAARHAATDHHDIERRTVEATHEFGAFGARQDPGHGRFGNRSSLRKE